MTRIHVVKRAAAAEVCRRLLGLSCSLVMAGTVCAAGPLAGAGEPGQEGAKLVEVLQREIVRGLASRGQTEVYQRYLDFTADRLDKSSGSLTWSDKTGNARLNWVDRLLRDPVWAIGESERFTRALYEGAQQQRAVARLLGEARAKLDLPPARPGVEASGEMGDALAVLKNALTRSHEHLNVALDSLSISERQELRGQLYQITTGRVVRAHSYPEKKTGRRVSDLLEKMDRGALLDAGQALAVLTTEEFLDGLRSYEPSEPAREVAMRGVKGRIHQRIKTGYGDIIVGSEDDNTYDLDELNDVIAVIDIGGNDTYLEGSITATRRVMVIIDVKGDDIYKATRPGVQGGAILGCSLLVDMAGRNQYEAHDVAQGAAVAGVGILVDMGGDTTYVGRKRVQGSAVAGVGLLLDVTGNDSYRAMLLGQGVGGSLGVGMAIDLAGDNHFYAGGSVPGAYDDSPGYDAWSQGVGTGPRGIANGGVGVLLVGPGDDLYECDYFSHGGGYWFGAGFARDFGGNDKRIGATRTQFDGSERTVKRFLRWGVGFQAHYGVGFVIDDSGDDEYQANSACLGFSWDIGVAGILDFMGNDRYVNSRAGGSEAAFGVLFDAGGDDAYVGGSPGFANEKVNYHAMPQAGGNFSFLVDYGGTNAFPEKLPDGGIYQRGAAGGFLISRPGVPDLAELKE